MGGFSRGSASWRLGRQLGGCDQKQNLRLFPKRAYPLMLNWGRYTIYVAMVPHMSGSKGTGPLQRRQNPGDLIWPYTAQLRERIVLTKQEPHHESLEDRKATLTHRGKHSDLKRGGWRRGWNHMAEGGVCRSPPAKLAKWTRSLCLAPPIYFCPRSSLLEPRLCASLGKKLLCPSSIRKEIERQEHER